MASSYLTGIFGGSPVKPLQEHMAIVQQCVDALMPFLQASIDGRVEELQALYDTVADLEGKADDVKDELRRHLPNRLFMPVSRSDLLDVLRAQDKIAGKAKDIAGLMLGRQMVIPYATAATFYALAEKGQEAVSQIHQAINELDELVSTGFVKGEVDLVESMLAKVDKTEHESDELQITVRKELFALEDQLNPVDVIFLYRVIDWTGDLSDSAEKLANRLQIILAR